MLIPPVVILSLISETIFHSFVVPTVSVRSRSQESKTTEIFLVSSLLGLTQNSQTHPETKIYLMTSLLSTMPFLISKTLPGLAEKHGPLQTLSKCKLKQFSR